MSGYPRRSFLKQVFTATGALSVSSLAGMRAVVAEHLAEETSLPLVGAAQRAAYMLAPEITYFNHGSIGTIPRVIHEAHVAYLALCESNPWRYMWSTPWDEARAEVREQLAAFMGCAAGELVFTHNTTEGFNLLAQGLPLGDGDEVLFSSLNHAGASQCWHHHGLRRGYTVRTFDFPMRDVPHVSVEDIVALHAEHINDKTRVLVVPHIDNIVGVRHPLRALSDMARARGVQYVAVDGAQAAGMIPLDLHATGVDFYANSPHKWLQAPKGTGLLYVREVVQADLEPMWVTWGQRNWTGSARVFEDYGTRNLASVVTLGDAVRFQQQGFQDKLNHRKQLWAYVREAVEAESTLTWRSPTSWDRGSSLYAIEVKGRPTRALAQELFEEHGYVLRPFEGKDWNTVRLSLNTFNTEAEVDRFMALVTA